jgi:phosphoribosylformylglycinamidine synthase
MLSESQERMLIAVNERYLDSVKSVFDRWGVATTVIGRATADRRARVFDGGRLVGDLPVGLLVDPPLYRLQGTAPKRLAELQGHDLSRLPLPDQSPGEALLRLLASPNIASKEWAFRQYDHQVQTNTVAGPGADAAVLRIKGTTRGIALTTDGNGRYCYLDPFAGGMMAVAEACRNLSCVGAEPVALTDCLNFGNPERPDTYYELQECIKGIALASRTLGAPVISGNVSLYNETRGAGIYPTPVIGALGLLEEVTLHVTHGFTRQGDLVLLLGAGGAGRTRGLSRKRVPGDVSRRPGRRQAGHRPPARGGGPESVQAGHPGRVDQLCARLLGWRPGRRPGRVLHRGRDRPSRSVLDIGKVGLGAVRRGAVSDRRCREP